VQDLPSTLAIRLVEINPGTFQMGSLASETGRYDNETRHKVTLTKPYELGQTLITQAQWQAVMGSNPSHFRGDNLPVEQVSNGDAIAFCNKLNEISGRHYRLPTEAEWEYACRAGTTTQFNTGDGEKAMAEAGWYLGNSKDTTHAVGQKKPNVWGLYDMHGDVCEWCSDWYGDYPSGDATDPHGPDYGTSRVLRGGSLASNPAENCRSAYRTNAPADLRRGDIGFRVARDLD